MKVVRVGDLREYGKRHGRLVALSVAAALLSLGMLSFSGSVRIDTEVLINNPGSTMGWLTIGRFGLVLLKTILFQRTYHRVASGILFLVFFLLGANLLVYSLYHFSGKREKYPYWAFMLLYVTSGIWCFQAYFSLQMAEVALAMLLVVMAANLSMHAFFFVRGRERTARIAVSFALLVIGIGTYQALAIYYIVVCLCFFTVMLDAQAFGHMRCSREVRRLRDRKLIHGIGWMAAHFAASYACYAVIARVWFWDSAYLEGQVAWGTKPFAECAKSVLLVVKFVLLGYGPRNFSFYVGGLLLSAIAVAMLLARKKRGDKAWEGKRTCILLIALLGIAASPFFLALALGMPPVTRAQFALPVAAAFLAMYGLGMIKVLSEKKPLEPVADEAARQRRFMLLQKGAKLVIIAVSAFQAAYGIRLYMTDAARFAWDERMTGEVAEALREENGGELPGQPVVFVGSRQAQLAPWMRRTEMYGRSFYEWDESPENPTGGTARIVGFARASAGIELNGSATQKQREEAVRRAEDMPDFPAKGSVVVTDNLAVVRLSAADKPVAGDVWW